MNDHRERDDLMRALARMPAAESDRARSDAVLARATAVMARRRCASEARAALLPALYRQFVEPIGASALAAAFLLAVFVQVVMVLSNANAASVWR